VRETGKVYVLLAALLALQSATVIDVQANHTVTLALQFVDTIHTAEFSPRDLKADSLKEGDRVQAEVKGGHMTVQRKDGRRVSGRVIQVQRVLIHPLPETPLMTKFSNVTDGGNGSPF
jgi:hypothetical protein